MVNECQPDLDIYTFTDIGRRDRMEDCLRIKCEPAKVLTSSVTTYEYVYFGVFDGHGGNQAAIYARDHLLDNIISQKEFHSKDDQRIMAAIREGFRETNLGMRKEWKEWPRVRRNDLFSMAGTTASIVFVMNNKYYVGHVGDSAIGVVNCNDNNVRYLTVDHHPTTPGECERIESVGGKIYFSTGCYRVIFYKPLLYNPEDKLCVENFSQMSLSEYKEAPCLALSRSLGDFWSLNLTRDEYIVSGDPDVSVIPMKSGDRCLLLASDGMSLGFENDRKIYDFCVDKPIFLTNPAHQLSQLCNLHFVDNITLILAFIEWPKIEVEKSPTKLSEVPMRTSHVTCNSRPLLYNRFTEDENLENRAIRNGLFCRFYDDEECNLNGDDAVKRVSKKRKALSIADDGCVKKRQLANFSF